ncbi:hypothetical protein B566_EDAN013771 [Ephemera danica]|nr:hypothetical protein B566_EDAN013771 [Ephemera danica]
MCFAATSCKSPGCKESYCGPFFMSRIYWADADFFVFQHDTKDRDKAWEDCALDYECATGIVTRYMRKFGRDCNGDGVTDCDDFAALHFNGGYTCKKLSSSTNFGRRYLECRDSLQGPASLQS